jgi:hypothetical protein
MPPTAPNPPWDSYPLGSHLQLLEVIGFRIPDPLLAKLAWVEVFTSLGQRPYKVGTGKVQAPRTSAAIMSNSAFSMPRDYRAEDSGARLYGGHRPR